MLEVLAQKSLLASNILYNFCRTLSRYAAGIGRVEYHVGRWFFFIWATYHIGVKGLSYIIQSASSRLNRALAVYTLPHMTYIAG
jgi:hypothetical protein